MKPNPFNPLDPNNIRISMSDGERRSLSRKRTYPWYALTIATLALVGYIEANKFLSFPVASSEPPNYPVGSHRYMTPPGQVRPLIEPIEAGKPVKLYKCGTLVDTIGVRIEMEDSRDKESIFSTDYDWEEIPEEIGDIESSSDTSDPPLSSICIFEPEPRPLNFHEVVKAIGYPQIAKDAGIAGTVIVQVLIDTEGNYTSHKLIKSVHPILDKAVEQQIHLFRFEPTNQSKKAIRYIVNIPFTFETIN